MTYDINNERQNHPELVVRDMEAYVEAPVIRDVLRRRGVMKWLRVRRLLIKLKHRWLGELKEATSEYHRAKADREFWRAQYLRGYMKALAHCRQQVRALCHSPRDVEFPDHPSEWGKPCDLPDDFPFMPNKRWFWKKDGLK